MNEKNNRVCCLYRVPTDKQVDHNINNEADVPMQRKACCQENNCQSVDKASGCGKRLPSDHHVSLQLSAIS